MKLLLKAALRSRAEGAQISQTTGMETLRPCCRQIYAPWHRVDPTSRGWPIVQRPRQRGPDSFVELEVSVLCGENKSSFPSAVVILSHHRLCAPLENATKRSRA